MIRDAFRSIVDFTFYKRTVEKPILATVAYLAFLGLLYSSAMCVAAYVHFRPHVAEAIDWAILNFPELKLENGRLTSSAKGRVEVRHPEIPEFVIVVDTERRTPVSMSEMSRARAYAYLTADAVYFYQSRSGRMESIDLKNAKNREPVVVDEKFFREVQTTFNAFVVPVAVVVSWCLFFVGAHFWALVFSLVAMLLNAFMDARLEFPALYRMSVYAMTPVVALLLVSTLLWKPIPHDRLLALVVVGVYLWQAIKQNLPPPDQEEAEPE